MNQERINDRRTSLPEGNMFKLTLSNGLPPMDMDKKTYIDLAPAEVLRARAVNEPSQECQASPAQ
jgi:hypothetical protein